MRQEVEALLPLYRDTMKFCGNWNAISSTRDRLMPTMESKTVVSLKVKEPS